MKKNVWIFALLSTVIGASAQDASPTPSASASAADVEALRQQVQSLTETVKALQQQVKDQQAAIEKANPTAPSLLENGGTPSVTSGPNEGRDGARPSTSPPQLIPTEDSSVVASAGATPAPGSPGVNTNGTALPGAFPTTDSSVVTSTSDASIVSGGSSLTAPIGISSGKNYMNISLDGLFALAYSSARDLDHVEVGDHDPQQRGFNARNVELAFNGAVDPYFEGFANIVFKLSNDNETEVEVEEAFLQTTNLPYHLQLKAGQFFAAFGRNNAVHPHAWDFVDAPLVSGRLLGPDGLRGVGAQISWTLPVPWYSQLMLAAQNGRGGTAYSFRNPGNDGIFFGRMTTDREMRGLQDFVWIPRFENSFNLSDTQTVLVGASVLNDTTNT